MKRKLSVTSLMRKYYTLILIYAFAGINGENLSVKTLLNNFHLCCGLNNERKLTNCMMISQQIFMLREL